MNFVTKKTYLEVNFIILEKMDKYGSCSEIGQFRIGKLRYNPCSWNSVEKLRPTENNEFIVTAQEMIMHEYYGADNSISNDVCLLRTPTLSENKPKKCNGCYAAICLPKENGVILDSFDKKSFS